MAQTIFSCYIHIIFSTKNRVNLVPAEIESDLFAYIGGICKRYECLLLAAGGTSNHIHLLISINKNHLIPTIIGDIKRGSSKWLKDKSNMLSKFAWQDGYSAFSVGYSQLNAVTQYISTQKEHHAEKLFEDEMRTFYRKYDIAFDEKYIWD